MAVPSGDIFFATISELGARLRAKEFSIVELTQAFLGRLEKDGPAHNALAHSLRKRALDRAKDADGDFKRGRIRGPLHGIPYGAKDLLAVQGGATEWGSRAFAGQKFDRDAAVIQRLDRAGAILIGKLAMIELAGGVGYRTAAASATGATQNPWDRARWAGGSSSGSAAAVAGGMTAFALGSETSGSIVTPAAFCGVTGLRPTYGLVSRRGAMALGWSLDKVGPLGRSAEDCALVLHTISGADAEDSGSARRAFRYVPQFDRPVSEFTAGFVPAHFDAVEPSAKPAFTAALDAFKGLKVQLKEIKLPDFPYGALMDNILGAEAASAFQDLIESNRIDQMADQNQAAGLKAALEIRAVDYLRAQRIRSQVRGAFRDLLGGVDLILAPTRSTIAPRISEGLAGGGTAETLIPASNLAGLPAISLPCGLVTGMPVAISLVARPFYENQMLALAVAYQKTTDWHRRKPGA